MKIFLEVLLGTLALLGTVVVSGACAGVMFGALFIFTQVLLGWGEGESPSGFAIPGRVRASWTQTIIGSVFILLAVAVVLTPMTALLVLYPPARIPSAALLLLIVALVAASVFQKEPQEKPPDQQPAPTVADPLDDPNRQISER